MKKLIEKEPLVPLFVDMGESVLLLSLLVTVACSVL